MTLLSGGGGKTAEVLELAKGKDLLLFLNVDHSSSFSAVTLSPNSDSMIHKKRSI